MDQKNPDGLDIRLTEFLQKLKEENDALKKVLEDIRSNKGVTKNSTRINNSNNNKNPQ